MKVNKRIIILLLLLVLLSSSVLAAPKFITSSRNVFSNAWDKFGSFVSQKQDTTTIKIVDFTVFFILFTSIAMIGLRTWGGKDNANAVKAMAVTFGVALSLGLVWGSKGKVSVAKMMPYSVFFLLLALFILFYKVVLQMQDSYKKNKWLAVVIALVLLWLFVYAFVGWDGVLKSIPFPGLSGSTSSETSNPDVYDIQIERIGPSEGDSFVVGVPVTFRARIYKTVKNQKVALSNTEYSKGKVTITITGENPESKTITELIEKTYTFKTPGQKIVTITVAGNGDIWPKPITWRFNVVAAKSDTPTAKPTKNNSDIVPPPTYSADDLITEICKETNKQNGPQSSLEWGACFVKIDKIQKDNPSNAAKSARDKCLMNAIKTAETNKDLDTLTKQVKNAESLTTTEKNEWIKLIENKRAQLNLPKPSPILDNLADNSWMILIVVMLFSGTGVGGYVAYKKRHAIGNGLKNSYKQLIMNKKRNANIAKLEEEKATLKVIESDMEKKKELLEKEEMIINRKEEDTYDIENRIDNKLKAHWHETNHPFHGIEAIKRGLTKNKTEFNKVLDKYETDFKNLLDNDYEYFKIIKQKIIMHDKNDALRKIFNDIIAVNTSIASNLKKLFKFDLLSIRWTTKEIKNLTNSEFEKLVTDFVSKNEKRLPDSLLELIESVKSGTDEEKKEFTKILIKYKEFVEINKGLTILFLKESQSIKKTNTKIANEDLNTVEKMTQLKKFLEIQKTWFKQQIAALEGLHITLESIDNKKIELEQTITKTEPVIQKMNDKLKKMKENDALRMNITKDIANELQKDLNEAAK